MRLLTSFFIILLCGFAIFRGWHIVHFVETRADLLSHRTLPRPQFPGLESLALQTSLEGTGNAHDLAAARRRRGTLARLLSIKPLSPRAWLELAGLRLITGEPFVRVLRALEMSWIVGPNEGSIMMERALFGLLDWRALPRNAQGRTLKDLAGAMHAGAASESQVVLAKTLLTMQPAARKERIARMLRMDGLFPAQLRAIGF
jgi:hypothetical protein